MPSKAKKIALHDEDKASVEKGGNTSIQILMKYLKDHKKKKSKAIKDIFGEKG